MTKNIRTLLLVSAALPVAFDNTPGWKMDGDKIALNSDGNPIYLDATGKEMAVEHGTIGRLNNEAKQHRETAEKAVTKLKAYEIDGKLIDPTTARNAIETVGKLDSKDLIAAGEVDKVKDEISKQFATQLGEKDKALETLQQRYDNAQIDNVFANSDFLRERIAIPRDMVEASFRNNFKMQDGKIMPVDRLGNPLYSKKRVGEIAEPDEALELLVDAHPQKDSILKANSQNGSGNGGGGGNRGTGRTMKRDDFNALQTSDPVGAAQAAALMGKGELSIVD